MESMAAEPAIDARMQAALARLTDNEKQCLRRRLQQQTAKEMALELGVSPHAVEKRLKMARTKLGLSSSLEAARLLVATERYQQTGPQPADLHPAAPAPEKRFDRPLIFGGLVMILVTAAILALAAQSSSAPVGEAKPDTFRMLSASEFVDGTPEELRAYAEERFRTMDQDGSGFVERGEAPVPKIRLIETSWEGPGKPTREWIEEQQSKAVPLDPVMAKAAFIANGDANADGKLSFDEYLTIRNSGFDAKQIPVSWREQRQAQR
jgi:DNA-binding CsgD family transcriptional regulator